MLEDKVSFLQAEYQALWEDFGVDPPGSRPRPCARKAAEPLSATLAGIREELGDCTRCRLSSGRQQLVFGAGNPRARLMLIGEGPGAEEDHAGEPFVGAAGQLLDKILQAMGLSRQDVYMANVVKCRPPGNRTPLPDEIEVCSSFLEKQIRMIHPRGIVALGLTAGATLIRTAQPMNRLRGSFQALPFLQDVWVMPTYHPAYLLQNPEAKRLVWDDMKLVMEKLKETPS